MKAVLTPMQAAEAITHLASGKTQQEVADMFGVSRSTIGNIKRGIWRNSPPRPPAKCGSNSGYARHMRRKERACTECCEAHAIAQNEYKGIVQPLTFPEDLKIEVMFAKLNELIDKHNRLVRKIHGKRKER